MGNKLWMPEDGMSLELSLIRLSGIDKNGEYIFQELQVGGRVSSFYLSNLPDFKNFAKLCAKNTPIEVDNYAYQIEGEKWEIRKATKEEMSEIVDDEFPFGYGARVSCIDHDGPEQFVWNGQKMNLRIETDDGQPFITTKGKDECRENRSQLASDLPVCCRMLFNLETQLNGKRGEFGQWLRIAYELNEDFELTLQEEVEEICNTIQFVQQQYGDLIARRLYNEEKIILPTEIKAAARYMYLGGNYEDAVKLANEGILLAGEALSDEDMLRMQAYMAQGGDASQALQFG